MLKSSPSINMLLVPYFLVHEACITSQFSESNLPPKLSWILMPHHYRGSFLVLYDVWTHLPIPSYHDSMNQPTLFFDIKVLSARVWLMRTCFENPNNNNKDSSLSFHPATTTPSLLLVHWSLYQSKVIGTWQFIVKVCTTNLINKLDEQDTFAYQKSF